jgi:chromosome segregation ATPase
MKGIQERMFVVLALAMCGLCAYQWYELSVQRGRIVTLAAQVAARDLALREATNTVATSDHQVARLDAEALAWRAACRTNAQLLAEQRREVARLHGVEDGLAARLEQYRSAVDTLTNKVKTAYDGIESQNSAIKQLTAQRDELVAKCNASMRERNELVAKYNDLVKRLEPERAPERTPEPPGRK